MNHLRNVMSVTLAAVLGGSAFSASALEWNSDWGPGFEVNWKNKLAAGAQWRLEAPHQGFIGKSNLDPGLCAPDMCISLSRNDLEPHQRWMAAPGGNWQIGDEANLIHQKGDITSAVTRWRSELMLLGGDGTWGLNLGWSAFYDNKLDRIKLNYPNLMVEEGAAPGVAMRLDAPAGTRHDVGRQFELREANIFFRLPSFIEGRQIDVKIGRQHLTWGEALFAISGTLNFITPINFNNFFRPTMDLDEAIDPVAMINLKTALTDELSVEAYYELEWRPYQLPARGSLWSFLVDLGTEPQNRGELSDDSIPLPFGKSPEDPLQLQRAVHPVAALISDTAASVPRLDNREPRNSGQYGIKFSYYDEGLLGGTEFSAFFANHHARLPAASFLAAQSTCAAAEASATGQDAAAAAFPLGLINFMRACGSNVANVGDLLGVLTSLTSSDDPKLVGPGYDALPLSSARIFLDYPEDIHVFGLGFNTTAFGVTWTGELAYRPQYPFQVDLEDVFFTALQPIFPRQELALFPQAFENINGILGLLGTILNGLPLDQVAGATFTSRRNALPDYLTAYRGGTPGEIEPGSYVRGYEKFDYWQGAFGGTWLFGRDNGFLWADQMVVILEGSFTYVPGLPSLDVLQLDSLATTNTHYSPGIEETGDALKLNPFMADPKGFPTSFAWGYKAAAIWSYDNVWLDGLRIRPQAILFHDVKGITPGLGGNFQRGRKIVLMGVNFNLRNRFGLSVDQFMFFGGGDGNRLSDRDFVNVAISYQF